MRINSSRGLTLIEIVFSLSIFTIISLTVASALTTSTKADGESFRQQAALNALREMIAHVQRDANTDVATVHQLYDVFGPNGADNQGTGDDISFTSLTAAPRSMPSLRALDVPSQRARIVIRCYRNEQQVPRDLTRPSLGPPPVYPGPTLTGFFQAPASLPTTPPPFNAADLNMDGDADDTLLPSDLKLIPMSITLTWVEEGGRGRLQRTIRTLHYAARTTN